LKNKSNKMMVRLKPDSSSKEDGPGIYRGHHAGELFRVTCKGEGKYGPYYHVMDSQGYEILDVSQALFEVL
jgi:hypothetical protein